VSGTLADLSARGRDAVFDAMREAVIIRDPGGRVLGWNRAAERLYGWSARDILGCSADDLLHSRPRSPADGVDWAGVVSRTTSDRRTILVDAQITACLGDDGVCLYAIETARDITEERSERVALEQSEYRHRNLFQAMTAAFWEVDVSGATPILANIWATGVTDLETYFAAHPEKVRELMHATHVIDVNEHTVAQFGDGDREILLKDVELFWPEESYPQYVQVLLARLRGESHYTTEAKVRTVTGRLVDVVFTACLGPELTDQGRIIFGAIDLSNVKQANADLARSQKRFRNLFQHMPLALCQLDASGLGRKYREWTPTVATTPETFFEVYPERLDEVMDTLIIDEANVLAQELLGATDEAELIGMPVRRFWARRRDTFQRVVTARLLGQLTYQEETQVVSLDGRVKDIIFACAFQQGEGGRDITLIGMADIGDRVKAQQMLSQLQADFAHAARISMLGELTASLAHEVSQPLMAIAANADAGLRWLNRPEPDLEEARDLTERIVGDARRASGIISRIRGMAGRRLPEPAMIDLNIIVEGTAKFLESQAQSSGVLMTLRLGKDLPAVMGDRTQLEQVIANLAINAMQALVHSGQTHRAVTLTTRRSGDTGLECLVEDNGPGIAQDSLDRLFESFFTTKPTGMGLGLPICRSIVQSHGGQLRAANRGGGRGARFTFSLPTMPAP